jgi:glycosylphosphatidylinositol deacylase
LLTLDLRASLGRLGPRLWPFLASASVGLAALVLSAALGTSERGAPWPAVGASLSAFARPRGPLVRLLGVSLGVALLPLPAAVGLGTRGEPLFAPLAPAVLVLAYGLVCASWALLAVLLWLVRRADAAVSMLLRR